MMRDNILIKGARENNLKNIDIEIPRDKFVVFTGLSGSGKSSLAFDTIYAEGQRRYVESLSSYARMFLGQMEKPDVDYIEGLSPAISIDQKTTSRNPRSTVGTITEIHDYLRLLYARVGIPHCPICGVEIKQQPLDRIIDSILSMPEQTKIQVLAPVIRGRKGEYQNLFEQYKKSGYVRVRVDGIIYDLNEQIPLDKNKKHDIEVVVDRLVIRSEVRKRLTDSCETASRLSNGLIIISVPDGEETMYSQRYSCPEHDIGIEELTPRMFSFNNPMGACKHCSGLGFIMSIDPDLVIPNKDLSLIDNAINAQGFGNIASNSIALRLYTKILKKYGLSVTDPISKYSKEALDDLLYGSDLHEGVIPTLERRYKQTTSNYVKQEMESLMQNIPCPECHGARLNELSLAVTVGGVNINDLSNMSIKDSLDFINNLKLSARDETIADQILKEIRSRLGFLQSVGLEYLTLSRSAGTLSGGEAQRIRLATQIGSSLMGCIYILDEPSIGLHQRDNAKLLATLKHLRDLGNTLIVVEHDEDTMLAADHVVDIGPGAGVHGGYVVAQGTPQDIMNCRESITGQYLSGVKSIPIPKKVRKPNGQYLSVIGATENNLKNIDVDIPLSLFTCVTGVSGSGKSSLVNEILYKSLSVALYKSKQVPGKCKEIKGLDLIDKVVNIDQSPIGRTPRSNPATYTGIFNDIRELFAQTPDAKARGYKSGRFSFNIDGGRCEACQGDGIVKIEMHFLPDIYVPCDVCGGQRYNRETLEVKFKGKNIYEVLEMTVEEGLKFFENIPNIARRLQTLYDVGLGYIKIGQSSTTLSGGEAQRVKLATELSKRSTGRTVYILDEPTTGLHTADVHKLIEVLQKLANTGNTVVVIEHNLDVIKCADHIIDLGPEGGDKGGTIVVTGTPEEVSKCEQSYTGHYLKHYFENR
ncbi:MAG: excinuclease ABC subunit UvrA [Clostridia bacterium]|nr:excinuclease ABC subunit UvrA [Clostridia bacterium]